MFDIFKRWMRALCGRNSSTILRASWTNPRSSVTTPGRWAPEPKRRGWKRGASTLGAAVALAMPMAAFPHVDEFVQGDQVVDLEEKVNEVVRSAYHLHYGESDTFDSDRCSLASANPRVDLTPVIATAEQRRRVVEFIAHEPRYARLVLDAYYTPW